MAAFLRSSFAFLFLLCACNLPGAGQPAPASEAVPEAASPSPTPDFADTACGFVWAREPLAGFSEEFDRALKESLPQASGYAEAYGENCLNNQGEVVRFLAMETDFYVMLEVDSLENKQALGGLIEQVLEVVSQFPVEETPGPQPGYVGITFEAPEEELRLWFTQTEAQVAIGDGLRGEQLFLALQK